VARGLVESRHKAQAYIMAGKVFVDGMKAVKAGARVGPDSGIEVRGQALPYVSWGGNKLEKALDYFQITTAGRIFLDVGTSTGGFTDCLLHRGAARVYAVDVGYGQLAWKLRSDARVVLMERTNIRYLDRARLQDEPDVAVIDVSFISLAKVIPAVVALIRGDGEIIALVKPQFELSSAEVGSGGIVRDAARQEKAVNHIVAFAAREGLSVKGIVEAPAAGPKKNREFFIYLVKKTGS
jgi:23S rRNA (cytidine1920-2'-O)/16S rRNA (cytidine1409-2'-O)-methyltransferase